MADSLICGHISPRRERLASYALGMRWKETQQDAGLPTIIYCNRRTE